MGVHRLLCAILLERTRKNSELKLIQKGRDSRGGKERPLMQTLLVDRRTLSTTDRDNYSRCACVARERKREGVEEG